MNKTKLTSDFKNIDDIENIQKNWIIAGGLFIFFVLLSILIFLTFFILNTQQWSELLENKIEYIIKAWTTAGLIWGGTVGAINVFFGAKRAFAMEKSAEAANKTAEANFRNAQVSEDKQITERFSKAIEQLGSEKIEVRLGAIYTLERIAKDSKKDHWTIIEVLTAFVRKNASLTPTHNKQITKTFLDEFLNNGTEKSSSKINWFVNDEILNLPLDIQEALTVIARRNYKNDPETQILTLSNINISKVFLTEANLSRANFSKANFTEANLSRANFSKANFTEANLSRANFTEANLIEANLIEANLIEANLRFADLIDADLTNATLSNADLTAAGLRFANLTNANLTKADLTEANLTEANLTDAYLTKADLTEANFTETDLTEADLTEADLTGAIFFENKTIRADQIKKAKNWDKAYYDKEFRNKLGLPPEDVE